MLHLTWVREAAKTASLGHRRADALRLGAFHGVVALRFGLGRTTRHSVTARLKPDGQRVTLTGVGELAVLHEVLIEEEYRVGGDPRVIFDLGANVGLVAIFFRRRYPSARLVAVEADPSTYQRLVRNVAGLDVVTLHRAAAGADGTIAFHSSWLSIGSSIARRSPADVAHEVRASTLQSLMDEVGVDHIDLLKIDIEGAEFELLATAPLDRVAEIVAEVHYDLGDGDEASLRAVLADFELSFEPLAEDLTDDRWIMRARRRAEPQS